MVRGLIALVRELAPVVAFFFVALMLILLLLKLLVAQYSIEFYAFTRAAVGALILGKVVLLMEWEEAGRPKNRFPRAAVVAYKTLLYAVVVIVLGLGEKIFHAARETRSLSGAVRHVIADANLDRFLGQVLLISILVAIYLVIEEIARAMGKGALFRLFFESPSRVETSLAGTG
jgi:hypothetical protein